ncbi:hypothetical protein [Marinobacter sp. 2_MG-2023]|uniref:hypothetical protein n=1 Tax=Marinobacter sp. 2_MG-2023 TaxID=3062679 RepID=UPI0026E18E29|nr:hypothetical protein [Marinobacter sp. 2_MG-2023]MDO6441351.1 hypothetical protein [Marinobacter sp. 2_MG-2023]
MMYIRRNEQGEIIAASEEPLAGFVDVPPEDPDLQAFLTSITAAGPAESRLRESDSALIRVIEDLVDLLSTKGIIRFTDLPAEAQDKLMIRKSLRGQDEHLNLIDEAGDDVFNFD